MRTTRRGLLRRLAAIPAVVLGGVGLAKAEKIRTVARKVVARPLTDGLVGIYVPDQPIHVAGRPVGVAVADISKDEYGWFWVGGQKPVTKAFLDPKRRMVLGK